MPFCKESFIKLTHRLTDFGQPIFSIKSQSDILHQVPLTFWVFPSFLFHEDTRKLCVTVQCLCALSAGLLQAHSSLHAYPQAGASWLFPCADGPLYLPSGPTERGLPSAGFLSTTPRVQLGPGWCHRLCLLSSHGRWDKCARGRLVTWRAGWMSSWARLVCICKRVFPLFYLLRCADVRVQQRNLRVFPSSNAFPCYLAGWGGELLAYSPGGHGWVERSKSAQKVQNDVFVCGSLLVSSGLICCYYLSFTFHCFAFNGFFFQLAFS